MKSFQTTALKLEISNVFYSLCIEMKLNFRHFLLKLINVGVLITCERMGKKLKINKRLPTCTKHLWLLSLISLLQKILPSYFLSKLLFQSLYVFKIAIFSKQLLFRKSHLFTRYYFRISFLHSLPRFHSYFL